MAGKGDARRPEANGSYADNYDLIRWDDDDDQEGE